ncbi:hypothetical protein [Haladaptatus sp. NG-SE-30]
MSSERPRIPNVTHRTKLSLAVRIIDEYTGEPLPVQVQSSTLEKQKYRRTNRGEQYTGDAPQVFLRGTEVDPIINLSGYFLFLDIRFPDETITIEVTGGWRYLDTERTIASPEPDEPTVETIKLRPSPAYQFPSGATLLRGRLFRELDSEEEQGLEEDVEGATLGIHELGRTTETTSDGEFVLYFKDITESDVSENENGNTIVLVEGMSPRIRIQHDFFGTASVRLEAHEGRIMCYELRYDEDLNLHYRACGEETWILASDSI